MVTKFKSEYGNSNLERGRGKYENRPDLKKGGGEEGEKIERRWKANRVENLISELHRLLQRWHVPHRSGKVRAGIVIPFRPKMRRVHPVSGERVEQGGGKNREISLNTLRA